MKIEDVPAGFSIDHDYLQKLHDERTNPFRRALLKMRRNKDNPGANYIPFENFNRFETYMPGIEREAYYIVTASSGVGKTQISDHLFLYTPLDFYQNNADKVKVKMFYYSLEMSAEVKAMQAAARKIFIDSYKEHGDYLNATRIGVKHMQSIGKDLTDDELDKIVSYDEYFEWFYSCVDMKAIQINPYVIYKEIYEYMTADGIGKIHEKEVISRHYDKDKGYDVEQTRKIFDYYEQFDPNLFVIVFVDHAALLSKMRDKDKRENMEAFSEYMVRLRNMFGITIVSINQQAADQEGKDNYKRPTLSGLGDNKAVQRDADYILGLYDPARHNERQFQHYDMNRFQGMYRELILLKSRYGAMNISTDLFFDGAVNYFAEMPRGNSTETLDKQWIEYYKSLAHHLPPER